MIERLGQGIAGVDEAGRGPLAGPVVVAAVILPEAFDCLGIQDSKKLSPDQRTLAAERIKQEAHYSIILVEPAEIDRINILRASLIGMSRALFSLRPQPTEAYIDGNHLPPEGPCPMTAVIKGDGRFAEIAAASILAKTTRDALMVQAAEQYPGYGFEDHFGYPTPLHLMLLKELGPCPIHRRSYAPVRELLEPVQACLIGLD